jgi:hypothetical protein
MAPVRIFIRVDLPAPFSPHQGVNLPSFNLKGDIVQSLHAGEALADVLHHEDGGLVGHKKALPHYDR